MRDRVISLLKATFPAAWILVIVLLPITSLPLVARLAHSDMVAAPSALPLAWMVIFWFIPYLLRRGSLPLPTGPFLGFILVAILASIAAYFLNTPSLKDQSVISREGKQLFTLMVGICFYLVASTWPKTLPRLQTTLRLINYSGLVMLVWSLLQAYFTYYVKAYPTWMIRAQENVISVSGLFLGRATGFAFEPSWLANQLNMLYLPFWISSSLLRYSAHRYKLFGISFENVLLLGGLVVMFFSYSRVGWLAVLLVIAYLLLTVNIYLITKIRDSIRKLVPIKPAWQFLFTSFVTLAVGVVFLMAYAGGVYGLARLGSYKDPRLAALFETKINLSYNYINALRFAERAVYWATGWNIFNDYPVLGVGIGNAGFYFQENLPSFSWQLKEVTDIMFHSNTIPNTKSLWTRILAETGLVGFSFFMSWFFVLWQTGRALKQQTTLLIRVIGLAGILGLVALIIEGFSVDSFALPYLWITQGLLTSASSHLWREKSETVSPAVNKMVSASNNG